MAQFMVSLVVLILMVAITIGYGKRRDPKAELTWLEAMVAAAWVFTIMIVAYGFLPHHWLTWTSSPDVAWSKDRIWLGPGGSMKLWVFPIEIKNTGWFPVVITAEAVRDIGAVVIYAIGLAGLPMMASWWNNRGTKTTDVVTTSAYGRPLVKR